jgi:3-oxoacyl-[acyl-carrier-protein] synthase-1
VSPLLSVRGFGMTTAVGLTAPASCAAIRARLDGIEETLFRFGGEWLRGAQVPLEEPWRGLPRLAWLVAGPIAECLAAVPSGVPDDIPLLLGVAESDRPGRDGNLDALLFPAVQAALGVRFHPASRLVPMGRIAGAAALAEAARLVAREGTEWVIVAGVDSYLLTATLDWLFGQDRLLTEMTSNGFLPGEAGAAVLCGRAGSDGFGVLSFGTGTEPAVLGSGRPLRGDGMTQACREALTAAGLTMAQIGYRLSTLNGEQHFFREIDLATTRLLRGRHEQIDLLHPAGSVGEVGAAALPLALGLASAAAADGWAPGDPVLIAASNDDGRCAVVMAGPLP